MVTKYYINSLVDIIFLNKIRLIFFKNVKEKKVGKDSNNELEALEDPKSDGMFPIRPRFDLNSSDSKLLTNFSQVPA